MPKTFSIKRTINLGRYGVPFESIEIFVEGAESYEDAKKDIIMQHKEIHNLFLVEVKKRFDKLNAKQKLTFKEEDERQDLKDAVEIKPF